MKVYFLKIVISLQLNIIHKIQAKHSSLFSEDRNIFTIEHCSSNTSKTWKFLFFKDKIQAKQESLFSEDRNLFTIEHCSTSAKINEFQRTETSDYIEINRCVHRQISLYQTEIKLYLPVPDWFGAKRTSVCCSNSIGNW